MTEQEFITNLKLTEGWDEEDYQDYLLENNPTGTDLEKRKEYLDKKLEATGRSYQEEDVSEFFDARAGLDSPTGYLMEAIPYIWYLMYMKFLYGCDYS